MLGSVRRLISLKQLPDGRFLLGGGWPGEFNLDQPRGSSLAENQAKNRAEAIGILPAVADVEIEDAWLGIEAVAIDDVPIIGPIEDFEGLVVAAGFSGHGFALSPAVGEAVAGLISTGELPAELAELTVERFFREGAVSAPARNSAG